MSIIGPNGETISGVFTRAEIFDPLGDFNKLTNKAAQSQGVTPAGAELLRNYASAYKTYYTQNPDKNRPVEDNPHMILELMKACRKNPGNAGDGTMSTDKIAQEIAKVNGIDVDQVKTSIGQKGLNTLAKSMRDEVFSVAIKTTEVEMTDKCRIDKKNTGMSIIADLLGISRVVCHAQSMKLKTGDGQYVDGTFMAMAKGVDPNYPTREGIRAGKHSLDHGSGLEDIADLQVLDYLGLNVDRHAGNMFYQFDEDGYLIGVQGIDNDTSLGTDVPQKMKERIRNSNVPMSMGVISKKTADRIMALKPEELAFALRGTIDEESIDACVMRLRVMKGNIQHWREQAALDAQKPGYDPKKIKFGKLTEYTSEDFRNISKENLDTLKSKKVHNHFYEISEVMNRIPPRVRPENKPLSAALLGEENRATMGGVVGQIKKADYMAKQLDGKTHFWRGSSSQNYQDIEKAVKKYKELQETILKRMGTCKDKIEDGSTNPEDAYGQYVNMQDMKKMKKALLNIKTAANKYATEKRQELADKGKVPDDDKYIKARIDFADEISAYVDSQLEISEAEKKTLDSNDRQSLEDYVRNKTAADQKKENNEINLNDQAQPENERILNL